jgi:copper transport protein
MRRAVTVFSLAGLGLLLCAPPAAAHAALRSSDPAAEAILDAGPQRVSLTFSEQPERSLSVIRVLDATGASFQQGTPLGVRGDPLTLAVRLRPLPKGVYTVSWRVVSRADGHATAGAFAFGVGVSATDLPTTSAPIQRSPPPSVLEMVGRWVLFVGLIGLLGGAWVAASVFGGSPPVLARLTAGGWAVAVAGIVLLAEAQRRAAAAGIGALLDTPLGRALAWRAAALVVAGGALLVARAATPRRRVLAYVVAGGAAAGAMLAHVAAGHAAAGGSLRWGKVAAQWAHFCAVGVWIGGLAALLLAVRGEPSEEKARATRRFSTVAGVALAVVAATGILRAVNEVDEWGQLTSTGYGRVVLVKGGLLIVIAVLGARNRYRNVPRAGRSLGGLRRTSSTELGLATVALGAAAVLASLAPPTPSRASSPATLVVSGSDFGTSVRARLEVRPGTPGPNEFLARITDYDTGVSVGADRVGMRFNFLDDPEVGDSTLALERSADGSYRARGTNLSLAGRWRVTLVIERGAASIEVPLEVRTRSVPQEIRIDRVPGQPTLYTIELSGGGSVQVYADPERRGPSEVHVTFFDAAGNERPIETLRLNLRPPSGRESPAELRRFSSGHFVADVTLEAGRTHLSISAAARDGARLSAELDVEIAR